MTTQPANQAKSAWHSAQDILYRFLCLYFLLYLPTHLFAAPLLDIFLGIFTGWTTEIWNRLVPWVGEHVLHLSDPITVRPGGSGDTTYNYVQVLVIAVVAFAGCLVWTTVDRKRPQEHPLVRWLFIACRYYLAFALLTYGFAKVFKTQFPFPSLERLVQPYGESSPMALAWTFMGYSTVYSLVAGAAEVLAGGLLFFRRTTTLGALVALAVLGNVVVMNFSYDIPVKLFSMHLLLMAVVLLWSDLRRVLQVFVLNRASPALPMPPRFASPRGRILHRVFKIFVIGASIFLTLQGELNRQTLLGNKKPPVDLYGLYEVQSFVLNGETRPPLTTDSNRWQHMIVERQGQMSVRLMDGKVEKYFFKPGPKAIWVHPPGGSDEKVLWTYEQPTPHVLKIEGELEGQLFAVRMIRRDPQDFLLVHRGFHWINEEPFNR